MLLNKNKSWVHGHKGSLFTKLIMILKYLTSDFMSVVFVFIVFILFILLEAILVIVTDGRCTYVLIAPYFLLGVFVFILVIGNVLVIGFDIIVTIRDICKGRCKDVFIKSDPFFFRLQQTIGFFVFFVLFYAGGFGALIMLAIITRVSNGNFSYF
jgi:hypothetical protein